jgi:hypothetical protein
MVAARTGSLGVANTQGDLYVVDANGHLERLPKGAEKQVLTTSLGALGPDGTVIDLAWKDPDFIERISLQVDALDPVFNKINIGGAINLPTVKNRGTHSVLAYDDGVIEGIAWQRYVPLGYTPLASLELKIYWVADTAIVGDVVWAAAFERDQAGGHDIDADDFAALQTAAASTAPGVAGVIAMATIPFTNAQADAIVAGNPFRLFIQRTANAVGDTMVGDAQLVRAVLEEVV